MSHLANGLRPPGIWIFFPTAAEANVLSLLARLGTGDALVANIIHGCMDGDLAAGLHYGITLAALALSQFGDMVITNKDESLALGKSEDSTLAR